jgi:hypothetical protein
LDVLASLCDLANIEVPATSEGKSFKPILMGKKIRSEILFTGFIVEEGDRGCAAFKRETGS